MFFYVVFTDFTNNNYQSAEEKKVVARNKDPIVFGAFENSENNIIHERLYFITDWEDEYCDLTFGKMITKMSELGIKKPAKTIDVSKEYINEIIMNSKNKTDVKNNKLKALTESDTKKKTFLQKIAGYFK